MRDAMIAVRRQIDRIPLPLGTTEPRTRSRRSHLHETFGNARTSYSSFRPHANAYKWVLFLAKQVLRQPFPVGKMTNVFLSLTATI